MAAGPNSHRGGLGLRPVTPQPASSPDSGPGTGTGTGPNWRHAFKRYRNTPTTSPSPRNAANTAPPSTASSDLKSNSNSKFNSHSSANAKARAKTNTNTLTHRFSIERLNPTTPSRYHHHHARRDSGLALTTPSRSSDTDEDVPLSTLMNALRAHPSPGYPPHPASSSQPYLPLSSPSPSSLVPTTNGLDRPRTPRPQTASASSPASASPSVIPSGTQRARTPKSDMRPPTRHGPSPAQAQGQGQGTAIGIGNGLGAEPDRSEMSLKQKLRISMEIPTSSLFNFDSLDSMSFSNRGSLLFGPSTSDQAAKRKSRLDMDMRQADLNLNLNLSPPVQVNMKTLSTDEEMLSRKVRQMYGCGNSSALDQSLPGTSSLTEGPSTIGYTPSFDDSMAEAHGRHQLGGGPGVLDSSNESMMRDEHELAGGIEDWEDVDGKDVDRYGFIVAPRVPSASSSPAARGTPEPSRPQRISTMLQIASEAPRRKRSMRQLPSSGRSPNGGPPRTLGRKASARSLRTVQSVDSYASRTASIVGPSTFRYAANRLPLNKDRRAMDEASDMLTLPPGLTDPEEADGEGKLAKQLREREWARAEKWRKMAKITKNTTDGGGMAFDFDPTDPKVISRTWKGIPDRWRATAWHSFLSASANKSDDSPTDEHIIHIFHDLIGQSSADDVQIDIDVPRTINSHIMFRRRYRGGQRLLFRVLHCLSLYFANTGYVQGMASLAATLLCYYDEEMAFVMLVRLWQLRGLGKLYADGFAGLMEALDEFEKGWLAGGKVAPKLMELGIDPTAYGTRWYLTLFNYSIPFAAQLRVWDVFMLLGEPNPAGAAAAGAHEDDGEGETAAAATTTTGTGFGGTLDVLHATSAALIDGMRDILLESDFENAMKVLTSWVPIKDEEVLMKVARAEWKLRRGG